MKRREFITLLGGAAASWPLAASAQQPAIPVIGFGHPLSPYNASRWLTAFKKGLNETGYVEGENVAIEYRWAEGQYDRLPALMADLVRHQVAVIVAAGGEPSPQAAKGATQTIPIVFTASVDPVSSGLVASLNRPGGNVTGVTIFGSEAIAKRVELLRELVPNAASIAYLMNPTHPNAENELRDAQTAAHSLGEEILVIATVSQRGAQSLLIASDSAYFGMRADIISLAARLRLPAMYFLREFAQAGGLITYGNSLPDVYHHVGVYVGKILKGAKPADLPVQLSTKFELVINLRTAKVLGLEVPPSLLARADEVIE
jgi:putative tryptophan/tyrosine transport system substrate-binding protein